MRSLKKQKLLQALIGLTLLNLQPACKRSSSQNASPNTPEEETAPATSSANTPTSCRKTTVTQKLRFSGTAAPTNVKSIAPDASMSGTIDISNDGTTSSVASTLKLNTSATAIASIAQRYIADYETIETIPLFNNAQVKELLGKSVCDIFAYNSHKIVSKSGKYTTEISYSKPIFFSIDPKSDVAQLKQELSEPIRVDGITATIASNNTAITNEGVKREGFTELRSIPPQTDLVDSAGNKLSVNGDFAFRFTLSFNSGPFQDESTLVLNSITETYIKNGEIVAIFLTMQKKGTYSILYFK